jgi:hypothetical protein
MELLKMTVKWKYLYAALLVTSCGSQASGNASVEYNRSIECEMLLGIVGTVDKRLSQSDLLKYYDAHNTFAQTSADLGKKLGKSPLQIDQDRAAYVDRLRASIIGPGNPNAAKARQDSRKCAGLS